MAERSKRKRTWRDPRLVALLAIGLVCMALAGAAEELPSVELPTALARVLTDYESAWRAKDAAALAALFAEDGFVLSSGVPPVRGRAAIEKHYAGQGGPLSLRALAYATEAHPVTSSAGSVGGRGKRTLGSSR